MTDDQLRRDYEWLAAQYLVLHQQHNALSHEVERLRERAPALCTRESVVITCSGFKDTPYGDMQCASSLELRPLHDTDVPVLVRLAGWTVVNGERRCVKCSGEAHASARKAAGL